MTTFLNLTGAMGPFKATCAELAAGAEIMEACKNDNFNTASYEEMVDQVVTPTLVGNYRDTVHHLHEACLVLGSSDIRHDASGVNSEKLHQCIRVLTGFQLTLTKLLRMPLTGTPTHKHQ